MKNNIMQNSKYPSLILETVLTESSTPIFMAHAPDQSDPKKLAITFGTSENISTVYLPKFDGGTKTSFPKSKEKTSFHLFDFYSPASAKSPSVWCEVSIQKNG